MTRLLVFYSKLLGENWIWLKRVLIWSVLWVVIGVFTYTTNPGLLPKFLKFLEGIFRDILGQTQLSLNFASVLRIFENNLTVGLAVMFVGIFFGVLPLLSITVNFFIFGFLFAAFVGTGQGIKVGFFILSIVPHGIVELPTFLIAAAFGLKLGAFWFRPDQALGIFRNLKKSLKENLQLLPLLALLFFVAAVLEVFVSGSLVEHFAK